MSSRASMTGLKSRIADALIQMGYDHPFFTVDGKRGSKKMSNKAVRNLGRNLGVSMKEKENRLLLKRDPADDVQEPADPAATQEGELS